MLSFVYKYKLTQASVLLIQLALFLPILGETQAPAQDLQTLAPEQEAASSDQHLSPEIFSGLGQDLGQDLEEAQEDELALKQENFEKLPQHLKDAYSAANQKYVTFLKQIDIKNGLKSLIDIIKTKLDLIADQKQNPETNEQVKRVKDSLNKFEEALFAGAFKLIPAIPQSAQKNFLAELLERMKAEAKPENTQAKDGELEGLANFQLNFDEKDKKNEAQELKCKFEKQDFTEIFDAFGKMLPTIKETNDAQFLSDILTFRNLIITVETENQSELIKRYMKFILPIQQDAASALRALKKLINQELAPLKKAYNDNFDQGEKDDPKINAGLSLYSYWSEEVEQSINNIRTFESLKSSANSIVGQTGWLFDKAGFMYDLARPILTFYLQEKFEKHGKWAWIEQAGCEFGVDVAFTLWMRKIQDFKQSKPKLDSHLLNGEPFGKAEDPMSKMEKIFSVIMNGGNADPMTIIIDMMSEAGSLWERRLMKGGLFLYSAINFANTPKGLSRALVNLFNNHPHIAATSLEIKALLTEYGYQVCKERYNSGKWTTYPSYDMRNKLRIYGRDKVKDTTNLVTGTVDRISPSFWTNCDRFSAGIINPGIFSSLTPKIFDLFLFSKGWMDEPSKNLDIKKWVDNANLPNIITAIDGGIQPLVDKGIINQETADRYAHLKLHKNNTGSIQRYVIESLFVSHIISCVGTKLAKITVNQIKNPLFNATFKIFDYSVEKILSIGQSLNLISEEDRDDMSGLKSDVEGLFDQLPHMIHQLIMACSNNNQGQDMLAAVQGGEPLMFVMSMMLKQSLINILPTDSPEVAKYKTVVAIIRMLSEIGILSYSDSYSLAKTYKYKMQLSQEINTIKGQEITEELMVNFTSKLAKYNIQLTKDLVNMVKDKKVTNAIALSRIDKRLDVEFSKTLTEKIKVGLFAGVLSKTVFVPLINHTVGNYIRDNYTLGDGVDWVKNIPSLADQKILGLNE